MCGLDQEQRGQKPLGQKPRGRFAAEPAGVPGRRAALGGLVGLAAMLAAGPVLARLGRGAREGLSADQILAELANGNERFRTGKLETRDLLDQARAGEAGQQPAAVILSCIDSRAPAELVLDQGLGDVFNTRTAGNVINPDILGGIEFSCRLAGAKVVLVMGHTKCGAVAGAISRAELGNLTGLLDRIRPAVEATRFAGERVASNYAFVDAVAETHVRLTLQAIRSDSEVLRTMEDEGRIRIAGGIYDLHENRLRLV